MSTATATTASAVEGGTLPYADPDPDALTRLVTDVQRLAVATAARRPVGATSPQAAGDTSVGFGWD